MQQSLGMQIHLVAAVVLAKAPVVEKGFAVQEGVAFAHAFFHVGFRKVTAMGVSELCHEPPLHPIQRTGAVIVGRIKLHGNHFHALDTMDFRFADDFHFRIFRALAFREVVHTPGQFLPHTRHDQPALQLLPADAKRLGIQTLNGIVGNIFRQFLHSRFSFRFLGLIWILVFEMLLGCVKPAFHRSHRNIQQLCDLSLGKFFPEIQVEDLLIFIPKPIQGFPHGMHYRNTKPSSG